MAGKLFDILPELETDKQEILINLVEGFNNQYNADRSIVRGRPCASIIDFTKLLSNIIAEEQRINNIGERIFFRQAFSPFDYGENELLPMFNVDKDPNDIISFKILKRTPGTMKGGNKPHDPRRREVTPHLREVQQDPNDPGYRNYVYGQWYDNSIELTIWSLSNKNADKIALWLEETMLKWTWYFYINGIDLLIYRGRGEDNALSEPLASDKNMLKDVRLFSRPLVYYIRTEKTYIVKEKDIEHIFINVYAR
jgi:hypothetical protein